jgi:hypothetical protein
MRKNKTDLHHTVLAIAILFLVGMYLGILLPACIPNPTQEECFKKSDCLSCVTSFCAWCGARPDVKATGKGCYSNAIKPADCEPPPHYDFCYHDSTTPINNRMYLKRPDGGADAAKPDARL